MITEVKQVANTVRELLAMGDMNRAVNLLIATGHGHHVTIGALTGPITGGGGGTAITIDTPEGLLGIGSNQCLIPVRISVQCEVGLTVADNEVDEILIGVDTGNSPDGINETAVTNELIFNMRGDLGSSLISEVQAWSAVTSALATAPTIDIELARAQQIRDFQDGTGTTVTKFDLLYEPDYPPLLMGDNGISLMVYWGGTVAVTGFAQIQVVVFPKGWVTDLD